MNYEIVELIPFSGSEATIYSIIPADATETLFDQFVDEYTIEFRDEIKDILKRIKQIGHTTGARESFFKHEGDAEFVRKYGKYVCALYDEDKKKLRLYCIRLSKMVIILGGGGYKSKETIKWQDNEKLSEKVREIMAYAESILKQLDSRDLYWSANGLELEGNLKHYNNE